MVTDFKTSSGKDSELFDILYAHFGKTINLSRLRFMAKMMVALVTLRTVNFARLSTAFCGKARKLQRRNWENGMRKLLLALCEKSSLYATLSNSMRMRF